MLTNRRKLAFAVAVPALIAAGCSNFLTGDKLSNNPNRPTVASALQLVTGSEVNIMSTWETYPFNLFPLWVDQIAGVQRQWADYARFLSGTDQFTADNPWLLTYGQGGLKDMLLADSLAGDANNILLRGEERVLRALLIGTAADIWGDIPDTQAGKTTASNVVQPTFDSQADVYAHMEALLDSAITDLQAGTGPGCSGCDFFFDNDAAKWLAAAHTLKARFYLHQSRTGDPTPMLNLAIAEAQQGIDSPDGDLQTAHTQTFGEQNLFYQFLIGPRAGDVEPSQLHISVIRDSLNEPALLADLYTRNRAGIYKGSSPGQSGGNDISEFAVGPTSSMGIVTFAENQMILAEAQYRTGLTSDAATTLNDFRAAVGAGSLSLSGGRLLEAIILEKFAHMFLNPEVWQDYLRTCVPNIDLPANHSQSFNWIPARLPYGYTETISNPNVPADQPLANANFPKVAADPLGNACKGQVGRPGS